MSIIASVSSSIVGIALHWNQIKNQKTKAILILLRTRKNFPVPSKLKNFGPFFESFGNILSLTGKFHIEYALKTKQEGESQIKSKFTSQSKKQKRKNVICKKIKMLSNFPSFSPRS